jgi:hypothetical protein
MARHLDDLVALIEVARAGGARVVLIEPRISARIAALLPDEYAFETGKCFELHRLTGWFGPLLHPNYINRRGAAAFLDSLLAPLLVVSVLPAMRVDGRQ